MKRWTKIAIGLGAAIGLGLAAGYAGAGPYGYGPGCGFGGGPGYGMGFGGGPGYGMGFGGGRGYGMGPGGMWGNGPGYGAGPGRMGGYGPGAYGYGGVSGLTNEQREKLAAIQDEFRDKQWKLMQSMHGLAWNQRGLYREGKFDEKAAREANDAAIAIRKQMFENSLDAQKRMEGVLTAKQREQLRGEE